MKRHVVQRLAPMLLAFAWGFAQGQPQGTPASPKVLRCTDANGRVIYTDKPELNCKNVRVDPPPPGRTAPAAAAKPPLPKARATVSAPEPRNQKTHCAAISKAAADLAAGKTGGLDAGAAAQRQASVRKELTDNCP